MKSLKRQLCLIIIIFGFFLQNNACAGIPVIDGANLAQSVLQVVAWAEQAAQMAEQLTQLESQLKQMEREYKSLNGSRGMGNLVNNPALRKYLPDEYQSILTNGYGNSDAIMNENKRVDFSETWIDPDSLNAQDYQKDARQAAVNRATAEDSYRKASARFDDIQVLLDKVNDAPDAKDMADLQGRIQAEQLMLQNEKIKLHTLSQLAMAQKDLQNQRDRDKSTAMYRDSTIPNW